MATVNGIQKRNNISTAKAPSPLSLAINSAAVKERFEKCLVKTPAVICLAC